MEWNLDLKPEGNPRIHHNKVGYLSPLDENRLIDVRKIIKEELLNEINPYHGEVNPISVVGTEKSPSSGAAKARAEYLKGHAEKNLSKLGIYGIDGYMDSMGITTLQRIKNYGKPFKFSFVTNGGDQYDGLAEYDKSTPNNELVLKFIDSNGDKYKLYFDLESLKRAFMHRSQKITGLWKGNKLALLGLEEGGVFDVKVKQYSISKGAKKFTKAYKNRMKHGSYKGPILHNSVDRIINGIITEQEEFTTKIKINKIGIEKLDLSGGGKSSNSLSSSKFVKIKGELRFDDSGDEGIFSRTLKDQLNSNLKNGVLYARLSEKPEEKTLIFSRSPQKGSEYFVVKLQGTIKTMEDPKQWSNAKVKILPKALNDKGFQGASGTIKNIVIGK